MGWQQQEPAEELTIFHFRTGTDATMDEHTPEIQHDMLVTEKRMQGAIMGSNQFRIDFPRLVELYRQGKLHLDDMISDRIGLDGITGALQNLKDNKGTVARQVVMFD